MKYYIITFIIILISGSTSFAKKDISSIPFVIESSSVVSTHQQLMYKNNSMVKNVDISKIKEVIGKIKKTLCNEIKEGEVKVWLSVEGSGKILGVGASATSGIEVTIKCLESSK